MLFQRIRRWEDDSAGLARCQRSESTLQAGIGKPKMKARPPGQIAPAVPVPKSGRSRRGLLSELFLEIDPASCPNPARDPRLTPGERPEH